MSEPRFIINQNNIKDGSITYGQEATMQICKVLRLKKGDLIKALDGQGNTFLTEVIEIEKSRTRAKILNKKHKPKPPYSISLFQALPKASKMDLLVQKATEIGVDRIVPYQSSRVIIKSKNNNFEKKVKRWRKISLEACRQSGRDYFPQINSVIEWPELLKDIRNERHVYGFSERETDLSVNEAIKKTKPGQVSLIVGPEGGFPQTELEALKRTEAKLVSLGRNILRTETAGIVVVTLFKFGLEAKI